jgi:hypothetical protein
MLTHIKPWINPDKIYLCMTYKTGEEEKHLVNIDEPFKTKDGKRMVVNKELELSEVK